MDNRVKLVGSLVLCLMGASNLGCGFGSPDLGGAGDSDESEASTGADEVPADSGEGSGEDGEAGSSGGDFDGESDDGRSDHGGEGEGGESGGSEDTGLESACVDDDHEDNDSIAFPGFWDGSYLGAMSCDDDLDAFQIAPGLPAREFHLQQSTGVTSSGEDFAQLVFELTCGQSVCDVDDSIAEWKSVSADACDCAPDERMFISVYPGEIGNPMQGTRYALVLPE